MNTPRPGYSQAFIDQRDAEQAAAAREAAANAAENARLGAARLAALDRERTAAEEQRLEEALAPERATAERRWRAAHPGKTGGDFARDAWPLLRVNLLEERQAATVEAAKAALRRTGAYGL